jgi:hypothetical protein
MLGRPIFKAFPDNPDDPTADAVLNLRRSLETVLATGEANTMALQRYDIPVGRNDAGRHFVERYWSPVNVPVFAWRSRGERGCGLHCLQHSLPGPKSFVVVPYTFRRQIRPVPEPSFDSGSPLHR